MNTLHTADYYYIESTLTEHRKMLQALDQDMHSFAPRALSDYEMEKDELLQRLKQLNPDGSAKELESIASGQIEARASLSSQFNYKFSSRLASIDIIITLLSHALCEAIINAILALGLAQRKTPDLFALIEKADMREKWTLGPRCFDPTYELPKNGQLHEGLRILCKNRNALVHHKITLHVDDVKVLDGSKMSRLPYKDTVSWLKRFSRLPYELHAHACSSISDQEIKGSIFALLSNR